MKLLKAFLFLLSIDYKYITLDFLGWLTLQKFRLCQEYLGGPRQARRAGGISSFAKALEGLCEDDACLLDCLQAAF